MDWWEEKPVLYDHRLDAFLAVARLGSISEAARALSMSQPAVSQHIASLEKSLGVSLFSRGRHGCLPTEAGRLLKAYAQNIVDTSADALRDIAALAARTCDTLVISSTGRMLHTFLYDMLDLFSSAYPRYRVLFEQAGPQGPLESVRSGVADLCVYCRGAHVRDAGLRFTPLFDDAVCCMVSAQNPLAAKPSLTVDDLVGYRLWLPPLGYADSNDEFYNNLSEPLKQAVIWGNTRPHGIFIQQLARDPGLVSIVLHHHMRSYPGICTVLLEGLPPAEVGLAHAFELRRAAADFVALAVEHRGLCGAVDRE